MLLSSFLKLHATVYRSITSQIHVRFPFFPDLLSGAHEIVIHRLQLVQQSACLRLWRCNNERCVNREPDYGLGEPKASNAVWIVAASHQQKVRTLTTATVRSLSGSPTRICEITFRMSKESVPSFRLLHARENNLHPPTRPPTHPTCPVF